MISFKRLVAKTKILVRKKLHNKIYCDNTKMDRTPLFICVRLMKLEDSLLLIAPVSDDKYIYNERLDVFVSLFGNKGTIVDRTYSYDIELTNKDWDTVERLFRIEMEKRTKKIEEAIVSKVKHSLDTIYGRISGKVKTQERI
jgi:hypothetical protein